MATESKSLHQVERALHESEARLQQVLDYTTALVFAKDRHGRYLFVNRAFERVARRDAEAICGRTDDELFAAPLAARFRHNDLRVLHEQRAIEFEETVEQDGVERTYLAAKFPLLDAEGAAYAVCGIATDITERKLHEEALSSAALAVSTSEQEALYRGLVRYLATILGVEGAFIAVPDPTQDGRIRMLAFHLDDTTRENFSYPLKGTPCSTVLGQCFRFYPTRLTQSFPLDADFQKLRIESYAGQPLHSSDGRPLGLISVVSRRPLERPAFVESVLRIFAVRVSAELERIAAAEALRVSESNYCEIFEASEDPIFLHDWDTGAIVDANPRACAMFGYSREEMVQLRIADISSGVPPYTEVEALQLLERAKIEGSVRYEWHRRNRDGSLRWDEVTLKSGRLDGRPRILAYVRDVTEAKQREQQLRQAQRMEAIGQLTGGIAHDFNNLLTSIMGYVGLALERQQSHGDPRLGVYLEQARSSCERARDLVRQMLMFSRGQRGSPRPLALRPVLEAVLDTVRGSMPATVRLEARFEPGAMAARVDPLQIEQVLLNLCLNARDAICGQGTIEVEARAVRIQEVACAGCRERASGEYVEVTVADRGHGMPSEVIERIFEPFFSTKDAGHGTGMGLAMVHGIVHEHGGHVVVESAPREGSRFRVLLPALPECGSTLDQDASSVQAARRAKAPMSGSVLVVDDQQSVGDFMRELLESWGLAATHLLRPQDAIDAIEREPTRFDVVVTDQSMPGLSGLQLAAALRERHRELPVILYSGYDKALHSGDARTAGIAAVLEKPVDPAALETALRRWLPGGVQ